jgi:hypothetical protein
MDFEPAVAIPSVANTPKNVCPFLQAVHAQIVQHANTVTDDYAEAICTHRTLFAANPANHTACAAAFVELAACVESIPSVQGGSVGRDAVGAFRLEGESLQKWWGN